MNKQKNNKIELNSFVYFTLRYFLVYDKKYGAKTDKGTHETVQQFATFILTSIAMKYNLHFRPLWCLQS